MFTFKHLQNNASISTITPSKDAVLFDNTTEYLYFDTQEGNEVVRHMVHAPATVSSIDASAVTSGVFDTNRMPDTIVLSDTPATPVTPVSDPVIHFSDLDLVPTANSTNAVTSGGIYSYISTQITAALTTSY